MSTPDSKISDTLLDDVMKAHSLAYAMSVIVGRALPDVRDGLKPVQRRILFAMHELRLAPTGPFVKSARVIGEVLGKYHPHGDTNTYETAVHLAQPWQMNHVLIDGQGNFGSRNPDSYAAMRYTEMRMSRLAQTLFDNIEKRVVDMEPNFSATEEMPSVLPILWPHGLVNGSEGIAVGLATNIPPHNLAEVIAAYLAYIANPHITTDEIMALVPAPDFPTGGVVHLEDYRAAVETGNGKVLLRATWHLEPKSRGAALLVIDSLPFKQKKLEAFVQMYAVGATIDEVDRVDDESSADNPVRLVVTLRSGADPELIFGQLVRKCPGLERSVAYNSNFIVNGEPLQLGFRDIFRHCFRHGLECIRREVEFDLARAEARLHLLEGLLAALGALDETIALIRAAKDAAEARTSLMAFLALDEGQAQGILDLPLQRLTNLGRDAVLSEANELTVSIADKRDILAHESRQVAILVDRVTLTSSRFAHERKTQISADATVAPAPRDREEFVEREDATIVVTRAGYVKRVSAAAVSRGRGSRGRTWLTTGDDDLVVSVLPSTTQDYLIALTPSGDLLARRVQQVPEGGAGTKGRHISNVIDGLDGEYVGLMAVPGFRDDLFLVTVSARGSIKRTALSEYSNATKKGGVIAVKIDEGDAIVGVDVCREFDHVLLTANNGKTIRFIADSTQMRPMGRNAVGTRGMTLAADERVINLTIVRGDGSPQPMIRTTVTKESDVVGGPPISVEVEERDTRAMDAGNFLVCIGQRGTVKRIALGEFRVTGRGGKGVFCFVINGKTGPLISVTGTREDDDLFVTTAKGHGIRVAVSAIRVSDRSAAGVSVAAIESSIGKDDRVIALTRVVRADSSGSETVDQTGPLDLGFDTSDRP